MRTSILDGQISPSFAPIDKILIHNTALPAANTNLVPVSPAPTNFPSKWRIQVSITVPGVFFAVVTNNVSGTNVAQFLNFNNNVNLTDSLYTFELLVHSTDISIDFRYSVTGGTIRVLRVQEIPTD